MPNLRDKTWTPTTPAQTADAQFWEDHLIDDASYEGLQEILEGGGGGGHVIQNPSGTEMPQQPVLQFINATVTNGEGKTIVSGNGEKGDAATVAVGTVTTGAAGTNAQVTNSGTQYDAVLDFVIPRGADGIPLGGTAGQTIIKQSSAEGDAQWEDIKALPTGGTAGQFLVKASADYGDSAWETKEVELTQAEYDALPASKLTDGVSYFITDGESTPSANRIPASGVTYGTGSVADALDSVASELNGVLVTPTLVATGNFSISQSNLYRIGKFIFGSIILQCTSNFTGSDMVRLPVTLPAYSFNVGAVSAGQWNYDVTKMVRIYFKSDGTISLTSSVTSGQYLTIPVMVRTN